MDFPVIKMKLLATEDKGSLANHLSVCGWGLSSSEMKITDIINILSQKNEIETEYLVLASFLYRENLVEALSYLKNYSNKFRFFLSAPGECLSLQSEINMILSMGFNLVVMFENEKFLSDPFFLNLRIKQNQILWTYLANKNHLLDFSDMSVLPSEFPPRVALCFLPISPMLPYLLTPEHVAFTIESFRSLKGRAFDIGNILFIECYPGQLPIWQEVHSRKIIKSQSKLSCYLQSQMLEVLSVVLKPNEIDQWRLAFREMWKRTHIYIYWRYREFASIVLNLIISIYWFLIRISHRCREFWDFIYPGVLFILWPIRKIIWFSVYQYHKRILRDRHEHVI